MKKQLSRSWKVLTCWVSIQMLLLETWGESIDWNTHKPKSCVHDNNFTFAKNFTSKSIDVFESLSVQDIYDIREDHMEFSMQIYVLDFWLDPLMKLDEADIKMVHRVPFHVSECIWTPDTVFWNSKQASLYHESSLNREFKVIPGGYFYRLSRYRITLSCQMDFRYYPLDTQTCFIAISFLCSKNQEAILKWVGSPHTPYFLQRLPAVSLLANVRPLQFALKYPPKMEAFNMSLLTGNTSVLLCSMEFERHIAAGLINTFIPSFLVVCLSFVGFWVDVKAIPGRVTLGVTSLLTLTTQIAHARNLLPPINYMTAMDVWLFGCLVMVFLSLIEFTVALSYSRVKQTASPLIKVETKRSESILDNKGDLNSDKKSFRNRAGVFKNLLRWGQVIKTFAAKPLKGSDNQMDHIAKIIFPTSMLSFTVIYMVYFSHNGSVNTETDAFTLLKFYL